MDPQSQAEFDRIIKQGPDSITDTEREYLRARRSYMTEAQRIDFGIVSQVSKPTEGENDQPAPVEAKTKRSKTSAADEQGA
jgi:hypothetical protein